MRLSLTVTAVYLFSLSFFSPVYAAQDSIDNDKQTPSAQAAILTAEQAGYNPGQVARSVFTSDIVDREPVDDLSRIHNETPQVRFFTDLRNMSGHSVIHRWRHNGDVISEVSFEVKGPRWRVWSSKNMLPHWLGSWEVEVVNTMGEVIAKKQFDYVQTDKTEVITGM